MDAKQKTRLLGVAAGAGLLAAAIGVELSKPRRKRTWHGRLAGLVPYDFRKPTMARVRASWWNPGDSRLLTPRVYGVGWDVNLARLVKR